MSFDEGYETRGVFVDISKAFDIIIKLKQDRTSGKLLILIKDFLSDRKQHLVLNGQFSFWMDVQAGIRVRSILGHLLFLIDINDLLNNLTSNPKLFADDMLTDPNVMANQTNNDVHNINTQAYQWKMSCNNDTSKQAQEVIFSHKFKVTVHPQLVLNNNPAHETSTQKASWNLP